MKKIVMFLSFPCVIERKGAFFWIRESLIPNLKFLIISSLHNIIAIFVVMRRGRNYEFS
jgi:hypothetical protein